MTTEIQYSSRDEIPLDVFTENHRAIDFYTARGYGKIEDRLLDLDGVDYPSILLRKSL
jgi:hypothetical protein